MVSLSPLLAASSLFWTLGWAFLIAAFIWLVIWWLLHPRSGIRTAHQGSATIPAASHPAAATMTKPAQAAAQSTSRSGESQSRTSQSTVESPSGSAPAKSTTPVLAALEPGDDLTRLGISSALAADLKEAGITRFDQIADWSPDDIAARQSTLGRKNPGTVFADLPWRARALADGVDPANLGSDSAIYGPPHQAPKTVDHAAIMAREFAGEPVEADLDLGIIYRPKSKPGHQDDLKRIKGVGPKLETELRAHGVHCFKQVAAWSDHNVSEFAARLNCFKGRIERDRWIPQAVLLKCSDPDDGMPDIGAASEEEAASQFRTELDAGAARQDPVYGIVYTQTPKEADDLKKIKGVANVLEGKLNEIGVYQYRQIAFWTKPAVKEFSKLLTSFKDRIYRDNWIAQARALHEKKYGEKL